MCSAHNNIIGRSIIVWETITQVVPDIYSKTISIIQYFIDLKIRDNHYLNCTIFPKCLALWSCLYPSLD